MYTLSDKQEKFRDFVFLKLGFKKGDYLDKYNNILEEFLQSKDYKKEFSFPDSVDKTKIISVLTKYTIVDWLVNELEFREKKEWKKKEIINNSKAISATDLASFAFCPASFSISNTFEIENTKNMDAGTSEHEKFYLLRWKKKVDSVDLDNIEPKDVGLPFIDKETRLFFKELKKSKLIFSGHQENNKPFFFNAKRNFVGQLDYVFKNSNGDNFIVEEKFKFNKSESIFFTNHKVQLMSYLLELEGFKANYGYLVYWHFEYNRLECKVLRIEKSEASRKYIDNIYTQVELLKSGKKVLFDINKLNINKCIHCSVRKWCGHKTSSYKELEYPYLDSYLNITYTKY